MKKLFSLAIILATTYSYAENDNLEKFISVINSIDTHLDSCLMKISEGEKVPETCHMNDEDLLKKLMPAVVLSNSFVTGPTLSLEDAKRLENTGVVMNSLPTKLKMIQHFLNK